jgi:MoxR-like ATPase
LATQNPIEQEGTYQLPEAQVDRFMLKTVDYPKMDEERMVVRQNLKGSYEKNQVVSVEQILRHKKRFVKYMDEKIEKYILDIIFATRYPEKYKLADLKPLISLERGSIS